MSANKARGTRWESAIRDYLNGVLEYSHPTDWRLIKRVAQTGVKDQGDLHAWPFVLEAKDCKAQAVPTWLRQAEAEAVNAGFSYGVVVAKVRGKGPALARVHISDAHWHCLLSNVPDVLSGGTAPEHNTRSGYWTWSLSEFAGVLRIVRSAMGPA